ncbi:hypothetical protein [Pyxidicoccus xibeiensis]|uniref:hypothetical protein n=1 Tax=Pyxidicoccus xibeiensis TaxID=2906759 RepID=UPI0020A7F65D|nr:hypothetical protein [Pyxidicoccus xibeiensis]MCP3142187.1 hypothetical protein [Pyxidicoccus xibeiensis]
MHPLSHPGTGTSGPDGPGDADGTPVATGLCVRIAGWTVAVETTDAGLRDSLRRMFSRFMVSVAPGSEAVARLEVIAPQVPRPAPDVRELPRVQRAPEGGLRLEGEDYSATLSAEGLRATVVGQGRFPVETVLKVMLATELARRGGLLVHGVALAHQGHAALFVGHSGAGKSTLGGLWAGAGETLLSDELVAVWPEGTSGPGASAASRNPATASSAVSTTRGFTWRAAGTPWNVGLPVEASLVAVGTLAWDTGSRWESQSAGEVGRMLLLNALLPEASATGRGGLLAAAGRMLSEVPPVRLVFARDASAAQVVRDALEAATHD